eukprot:scaffold119854_cov69-Phaeocystis_antarctica.AAC.1
MGRGLELGVRLGLRSGLRLGLRLGMRLGLRLGFKLGLRLRAGAFHSERLETLSRSTSSLPAWSKAVESATSEAAGSSQCEHPRQWLGALWPDLCHRECRATQGCRARPEESRRRVGRAEAGPDLRPHGSA